ncbi:MAG: molybdopterin-binding protein [Chloroflexota bacterium]|nr:MAG: molybdopterin-binding protein [Chloroflexota bacterium]
MRFEAVPIEQAEGHILGHNIAGGDGRRLLRKGKAVTADDIILLKTLGRRKVYVALIAPADIDENAAAERIATHVAGQGIRLSSAATGRVNMFASSIGVLRVEVSRLTALNNFQGVTLATLPRHAAISAGRAVATLKIIPYALPKTIVDQIADAATGKPIIYLTPIASKRVGLILSGSPAAEERVTAGFQTSLAARLERLRSRIERVDYVPLEDESGEHQLADVIQAHVAGGIEMIILAGETAIMDRYDIAPRAVERAGGIVTCFGAPVDPGNLLMLAYLDEAPVVGAPGCVRSPKTNIIDMVLPRLLAGDRLTQEDIIALAHGGLLEDVPERPLPRSHLS